MLRRDYFPGLDVERFCDADRDRILDDIDADLRRGRGRRARRCPPAAAGRSGPRTRPSPSSARGCAPTPAAEIRRTRVRVPTAVKLRLAAGALCRRTLVTLPASAEPGRPTVGRAVPGGPRRVVVDRRRHRRARHRRAARLARPQVDLLEKNDELGGRVGSVERDGFRFDTGASWYLMPEVFEHFFSLLGTTAEAELDLTVLDPSYRVFFEGHDEPLDLRPDRAHNRALFESRRARGRRARFDAYLRSAEETYDIALRRFLYSNFDSTVVLPAHRRRTPHSRCWAGC